MSHKSTIIFSRKDAIYKLRQNPNVNVFDCDSNERLASLLDENYHDEFHNYRVTSDEDSELIGREIARNVWNFIATKRNNKEPFEYSFEQLKRVILNTLNN